MYYGYTMAAMVKIQFYWCLQQARAEKELKDAEAKQELDERVADRKKREDAKARVEQVLSSITTAGYGSLYGFVDELLNIRDQQISVHVSWMLGHHGNEVLNSIWARQPSHQVPCMHQHGEFGLQFLVFQLRTRISIVH